MPYLPFGFPFQVATRMPPAAAKTAIRAHTIGWFDKKTGARGWIIGPVICLWLTALDPRGPMLLGWMSAHGSGGVIRGRAGSDLNGLLITTLWLLVLCLFFAPWVIRSPSTENIILAVVVLLIFSLRFLLHHKDRGEAVPLVRFLEDVLSEPGKALRQGWTRSFSITRPLTLNVNGDDHKGPVTSAAIYDAMMAMGEHDFLILSSDDEIYMQAASVHGGFIIERRDGDQARHFHAHRQDEPVRKQPAVFSFEDAMAVIGAYVSDKPTPAFIRWKRA